MIRWTFKKTFTSILTLLGIGTLTSCYGMAPNYARLEGTVTSKDGNKAVSGIRVRALDSDGLELDSTETMEGGMYYLNTKALGSKVKVLFEDVDGKENGSFKKQAKDIALVDLDTELNVELEDAGDQE